MEAPDDLEGPLVPITPPADAVIAQAAERRRRHALREVASATLRFDATQAEPNYAAHFLAGGGVLGSAAGAGRTDFSLTGAAEAVFEQLEATTPKRITIEVPEHLVADFDYAATDGALYVEGDAKLNVGCTREGAGVNGTYVTTHVGAGSMYLRDVLAAEDGHRQVPIVYGTLGAYSAVVGISNVHLELRDEAGTPIEGLREIRLGMTTADAELSARAEAEVDAYARAGWERRYDHVQYPHARTLTKTVVRVPVGLNDSGYTTVPYVVDQVFPWGAKVLNGLLERAIGIETRPADGDGALQPEYRTRTLPRPTLEGFLEATCKPGVAAAEQAPVVATALSDIANFLMPYRADGRTVLRPMGSDFDAIESWLREPPKRWDEANDCDGSALLAVSMMQFAVKTGAHIAAGRRAEREAWIAAHPYVWALRNVMHPHYTYGVAVVGAAAAEASNLTPATAEGPPKPAQLAGHAIALMIPTVQLLHALYDGSQQRIAGAPVSENALETHGKRFDAVFPANVRAELVGEEEGAWLATTPLTFDVRPGEAPEAYADTRYRLQQLQAQAVEGTTPAASTLLAAAGTYDAVAAGVQLDNCAFAAAAPNIARSRKVLFVGGAGEAHRFYHDIVEFDLPADHPWYQNAALRGMCEACGQIVFAPPSSADAFDDNAMTRAGVTPADIVNRQYAAVPLVALGAEATAALDHAAARAALDVVPPRPAAGRALSAAEAARLQASMAHLHDLNAAFQGKRGDGHPVSYILAYATLVHNPYATKHFCRQIAKAATEAHAEIVTVDGLATLPDADAAQAPQAGHFVVVRARVRV